MAVDQSIAKRFALHQTDHGLLDEQCMETLHTRIARYVAVRRERGEQMKAIVPDAGKRFKVSQSTVRAVYTARQGPGGALRT